MTAGKGRLAAALLSAALTLVVGAPGAAPAQEEIELRLPGPFVQSLHAAGGGHRTELPEELLRTNPWASRVQVSGAPTRFTIAFEIPQVGTVSLAGDRSAASRLGLGSTSALEEFLTLPPGLILAGARRERDTVVIVLTPPPAQPASTPLLSAVAEATSFTLRGLASHRYQRPSLGGLNPENRLLELPREQSEAELRLDAALDLGWLALSAKPRARWIRTSWRDGDRSGDAETDTDLLLQEGLAQLRLQDALFLSYGRENLQWGPGQLVNPSNPFFADNGRENPVREIPGLDFARAVWLPDANWTVSWITNAGPGEGERQGEPWRPSHALKVEYVGHEGSGGVLGHGGPGQRSSLRGFGQRTLSDALLVYSEGSVSKGSDARYPDGPGLAATRQSDARLYPFALAGTSYTLEWGPTLSCEYVFNGEGYGDNDAERFFDLAQRLGQLASLGLLPPGQAEVGTRLRLLRRNYLFAQYLQTELWDRLTVVFRWAQNLDDQSALPTAYAEWNLGDRWRLFGFGVWGTGGNRDEFGSVVRAAGLLGLEVTAF